MYLFTSETARTRAHVSTIAKPETLKRSMFDIPTNEEKRIKKFGEEHDYVNSFMVSAKTKKNLDEAMNCIIAEIILQLKNNEQRQSNAALRDMLRYSTISESTEKESREAKCC